MKYLIGSILGITLAASLSLVMAENIGAGSPAGGQDLSKGVVGPSVYVPDSGGAGYKGTNFAMTKAEAINAIKARITTTGIGSTGSTETWIDPTKLATYLYEHQLP